MLERHIKEKLLDALNFMPIVLLRGARQTGKTTLVKAIAQEMGYTYITFDHLPALLAAKSDPVHFIADLKKPVILDEIQRIPELFLPIKQDIDENRIPGRYILTGSADPLLIPKLGDSLAGRMRLLNLLPLSQGEILGKRESFIDLLFEKQQPKSGDTSPCSKQDILHRAFRGGYPVSVRTSVDAHRVDWFQDYVSLVLQKDVIELSKVEDLTQIPHLFMLLASRAGSLLNIEEVARSIKLSSTTLHRYFDLLRMLFLVYLVPAWAGNLSKRLIKSPKLYLTDTALQLFMLNMDYDRLLKDFCLVGSVIENFVVLEILKQISWSNKNIQLFHYRDHSGVEVDIILEGPGGDIIALEIKSSESVSADDFKGLKKVQADLGVKFLRGVVLYAGAMHLSFGPGLQAVPISALWLE